MDSQLGSLPTATRFHLLSINFERLAGKLLAYRDQIPHSDPHKAIIFALITMATVIEDLALEQVSMWKEENSWPNTAQPF